MNAEKLIRLPWRFYTDHLERELPTPKEHERSNKRHVWVRADDPALPELLSDARYYADPYGPDGGGADAAWYRGLKASAKATVNAIEAGRPDLVKLRRLHDALRTALEALHRVQPQVRGAIPMQMVDEAIDHITKVLNS